MNKKLIIITLSCVIVTALLVFWNVMIVSDKRVGELVFGEASSKISDIREIHVTTPEEEITLFLQDGLWRVKEAGGYYANYVLVNELLRSFGDIHYSQEYDTEVVYENHIEVIGVDGTVISDIMLGQPLLNSNLTPVKKHGENKVYLAYNVIELPPVMLAWLNQPLLELEAKQLENPARITPMLMRSVSYLYFEQVLSADKFDKTNYPNENVIELVTKDGIVIALSVFSNGEEYWVSKKISTTKLPTKETAEYVKNNSFLYDGWYFKIPEPDGLALLNYKIGE